jgi:hypothetical protein
MSANVPKLNVVRVDDPRLQVARPKDYVASKGAIVNSWQEFRAPTISNSSVQISCNPPSREIVISRLVLKRARYRITYTGTNTGGGPLMRDDAHAPRAFPISSTTLSEQMTINNATITQAPISQYWSQLLWYHNHLKNRTGQYSLCPSMLDQFQNYAEGFQTLRNPLAEYKNSSSGGDEARGGYVGYTEIDNQTGATTAIFELECTEPVLLSPFVFGENSHTTSGFANIQNMSYTCTFGNLARVASAIENPDASVSITGVQVELLDFALLFNYLTPEVSPPRQIESSYFNIVSYPTQASITLANGAENNFVMNSVQVSSIPRRMYVYARKSDTDLTAFDTDSCLSLSANGSPLTMTWNNNQFFSQASAQDLYQMSVKNGSSHSWTQFMKHTGSVVCIDFGAGDVGLMPLQCAGSIGNYQLGLQVRLTNTSGATIVNPTLYVVLVYEGVFNISDGMCSQYLGVLTPQDVANAKPSANITFKQAQDIYGGSFFTKLWGKIKPALRRGIDYAKEHKLASKMMSQIPDSRAQFLARQLSQRGYGRSGGRVRALRGGSLYDNNDAYNEECERKEQNEDIIARLTAGDN